MTFAVAIAIGSGLSSVNYIQILRCLKSKIFLVTRVKYSGALCTKTIEKLSERVFEKKNFQQAGIFSSAVISSYPLTSSIQLFDIFKVVLDTSCGKGQCNIRGPEAEAQESNCRVEAGSCHGQIPYLNEIQVC